MKTLIFLSTMLFCGLYLQAQTFTYDPLGRLIGAQYSPNGTTISYTYNAVGNRITKVVSNIMPLSVELLDLAAQAIDNQYIQVSWKTTVEINNNYFEVERSMDNQTFVHIGQVAGAGNSTSINSYIFDDKKAQEGLNYYRLKQIDFDGKSTTSNVVAAYLSKTNRVLIYPNPADEILCIASQQVVNISMADESGKVIYKGENASKIDLKDFANGVYFIEVLSLEGTFLAREKVIIHHE